MITMAKAEDMYAKALCQVMELGLIAQGIEPSIAKVLSGKACEVTAKRTGRAYVKGGKAIKKRAAGKLNAWQLYLKNHSRKHLYKSGKRKGQVNLKAASIAFRKTPAGKRRKKK